MCGIAGVYLQDPTDLDFSHKQFCTFVDALMLGIEHRGRDATGLAAISKTGELHIEKADLEASAFKLWRSDIPRNPQAILLHTRFATQGTPMNLLNNHPVQYDEVLVTHNGHISNDDKLFREEDLERKAEVDSEIISALFHKYGIEKAHIPLQKLDGNMAVAVADLRKPGALVLAKGWSSPLETYRWDNGIIWASTKDAIREALKESIGFEVKWNDICSLTSGDILYFADGEFEKLEFKAYTKPYNPQIIRPIAINGVAVA
jgi:glucosamine 6-phosphate synthetase-like amidotransferase/phosphosugar isomerase protein